jgi:hypothetical protein
LHTARFLSIPCADAFYRIKIVSHLVLSFNRNSRFFPENAMPIFITDGGFMILSNCEPNVCPMNDWICFLSAQAWGCHEKYTKLVT